MMDVVCDLREVRRMGCRCAQSVKNRARNHVPMPVHETDRAGIDGDAYVDIRWLKQ
jgi:hypothetical protein